MGFLVLFAVLIPGVQAASPSYHKRAKNAKRGMINGRRSPLPWIHLQELLYWSCGDLLRLERRLLSLIQQQQTWKRRVSYVANLYFIHLTSSNPPHIVNVLYWVFFYIQDSGCSVCFVTADTLIVLLEELFRYKQWRMYTHLLLKGLFVFVRPIWTRMRWNVISLIPEKRKKKVKMMFLCSVFSVTNCFVLAKKLL